MKKSAKRPSGKSKTAQILSASAVLLIALQGCEVDDRSDGIEEIESGIKMGSRGPEVEAVYNYLHRFGYFPNDSLAEEYGNWEPIIASAPEKSDVFDETFEKAILAFQKNSDLLQTGVVDEETAKIMNMPRCGVPDRASDSDQKWARFREDADYSGWYWNNKALTWHLDASAYPFFDSSAAMTLVSDMLQRWQAESGYSFSLATSSESANIRITFGDLNWEGNTCSPYGSANTCWGTSDDPLTCYIIILNTDCGWNLTGDGSSLDVGTVVLHEIGHALGLNHSDKAAAAMYYAYTGIKRDLHLDDKQGIKAIEPGHVLIGGKASSITAGDDGSIWITGETADADGYRIYKWNDSIKTWSEKTGRATQLAVGPGNDVWHINSRGEIYRGDGTSWSLINNAKAAKIAAGGSEVWILGWSVVRGSSDRYMYRWDGNDFDQRIDGYASDITINSKGEVWHINESGGIYRWQGGDSWVGYDGQARRIIGGKDGSIWHLGWNSTGNGYDLYTRNVQTATDRPDTGSDTPGRDQWINVAGSATEMAITTSGKIWHINASKEIYCSKP